MIDFAHNRMPTINEHVHSKQISSCRNHLGIIYHRFPPNLIWSQVIGIVIPIKKPTTLIGVMSTPNTKVNFPPNTKKFDLIWYRVPSRHWITPALVFLVAQARTLKAVQGSISSSFNPYHLKR